MITDPNKGNDLCTNHGGTRHDAMARFWCPDCQAATFEASGNHEEAARRRAKAAAQRTRPDPYDVFAKPNGYNHDKPSAPPAARGDVEAWHRVPDLQRPHDIRRKIRYAEQTLDRVCAEIAAMPADSGRNQATNNAAMRVGHLVGAGWLDLNRAHDALADACTRAGLDQRETATVTRRPGDYGGTNGGLAAGIADPDYLDHLDIPERDHPAPSPNGHTQATPSPVAEVDPARAVEQEKTRQRVVRAARRELDAEETAAAFREPPSRRNLREELTIPDKPITYRIADIMPTGSNTTVTAQWKAGKTTIGDNLARSLADGEPFLGRFDVHPVDGTIALWNYEVHEDQYRRWLRQLGVRNQEAICPLNLRGYRLPLTVPYVEDWVVRWLEERDVKVWALDPFASAFVGSGNENDNTDVGAWLDTLDVIKSRAGVSELILPLHTGRVEHEPGEERARGATRLDDWADGRWVLTKDKQETRYFSAMGRDVEFKESALHYDETTRRLTISGGSRAKESDKRIQDAVVSVSQTTPGITKNQLRVAVRQIVGKVTNTAIDDAATCAELDHRIRIELGANRSHRHYPVSHQ